MRSTGRLLRTATTAVAATTMALALTSCVSGGIPGADESTQPPSSDASPSATDSPTPAPDETPQETETPTGDVAYYEFDGLAYAEADDYVQWTDSLYTSEDFTVESEDNGQGAWSYLHTESQCIVGFWQGTVDGHDTTAGESAMSDYILAWYLQGDQASVESTAEDDLVTFTDYLDGTGQIQTRAIHRAADDRDVTVAARGFMELGAGLLGYVSCPAGTDSAAMWETFQAEYYAFFPVASPQM